MHRWIGSPKPDPQPLMWLLEAVGPLRKINY